MCPLGMEEIISLSGITETKSRHDNNYCVPPVATMLASWPLGFQSVCAVIFPLFVCFFQWTQRRCHEISGNVRTPCGLTYDTNAYQWGSKGTQPTSIRTHLDWRLWILTVTSDENQWYSLLATGEEVFASDVNWKYVLRNFFYICGM